MAEKLTAEEVSQLPMGWLNDDAPLNMDQKLVTFEVFQSPIGWLKDDATVEHVSHVCHIRGIPVAYILIEQCGST